MIELGPTLLQMHAQVCDAVDADDAWKRVITAGEQAGGAIPDDLRAARAGIETLDVVSQLRRVFEQNPLPPTVTFLYFGLFDGITDSGEEVPGFYVAGGSSRDADPVVESSANLPYFPDDRFLESPLLNRVKAASLRAGEDAAFFDYALMYAAAAVVAKFSTRTLYPDKSLVVGFDSGDRLVVT